jgi:hypothetical protein
MAVLVPPKTIDNPPHYCLPVHGRVHCLWLSAVPVPPPPLPHIAPAAARLLFIRATRACTAAQKGRLFSEPVDVRVLVV